MSVGLAVAMALGSSVERCSGRGCIIVGFFPFFLVTPARRGPRRDCTSVALKSAQLLGDRSICALPIMRGPSSKLSAAFGQPGTDGRWDTCAVYTCPRCRRESNSFELIMSLPEIAMVALHLGTWTPHMRIAREQLWHAYRAVVPDG